MKNPPFRTEGLEE
uniref:Uncharacterized protein n=1 Tax=Anguilla anguilla TaxID=7936 RepID=A0A0E9RRL6_ANGAN